MTSAIPFLSWIISQNTVQTQHSLTVINIKLQFYKVDKNYTALFIKPTRVTVTDK